MTSTITETIRNYTCVFKQQMDEVIDNRNEYVQNIIVLLKNVYDDMVYVAVEAKTYPQHDALIDLDKHYKLIRSAAAFQNKLEESHYFDNEQLKCSLNRVMEEMMNVEHELNDTAYLKRKSDRNQLMLQISTKTCASCPYKSLL